MVLAPHDNLTTKTLHEHALTNRTSFSFALTLFLFLPLFCSPTFSLVDERTSTQITRYLWRTRRREDGYAEKGHVISAPWKDWMATLHHSYDYASVISAFPTDDYDQARSPDTTICPHTTTYVSSHRFVYRKGFWRITEELTFISLEISPGLAS